MVIEMKAVRDVVDGVERTLKDLLRETYGADYTSHRESDLKSLHGALEAIQVASVALLKVRSR